MSILEIKWHVNDIAMTGIKGKCTKQMTYQWRHGQNDKDRQHNVYSFYSNDGDLMSYRFKKVKHKEAHGEKI